MGPYRAAASWVNRDGKMAGVLLPADPGEVDAAACCFPAASKPEKTAASPAATPAETVPDPIANEKLVWDLLKSRNFDGFAALLDPRSWNWNRRAPMTKRAPSKA